MPPRCNPRMTRIALAAAAVALLLAPAALAKGPSEAQISGPGIKAIVLSGDAESGTPSEFTAVVEGLGFFPAVFGQEPNPMLPGRPQGDLGPRYAVLYEVPGPDGRTRSIGQDLYPYATGGAVAYMSPGQEVFPTDGIETRGGWYQVPDTVTMVLNDHGLPSTAPGAGDGGSDVLGPLAMFSAILLVGALFVLALTRARRRPKPRIA